MKNKRGFTLIELLIVIATISVLSSVVLSSLNSARSKARNVARLSDVKNIVSAFSLAYYDTGTFPDTAGAWTCVSNSCTGDWATYAADEGVDSYFAMGMPQKPEDPSGGDRGLSGYLYIDPWTNPETGSTDAWLKYTVEGSGSCGMGIVYEAESSPDRLVCLLGLDTSGSSGSVFEGGGGESLTMPIVTTDTVINITATTATGGGDVSSDGGDTVIVSGVVWGTAANPTTALSTKTIDGPTSGPWSSSMTSLDPSTTYHVRAYATNGVGTSYGDDVTFTTASPLVECTGGTITRTGGYTIHRFASGGTLICTTNQVVDYLVVAGGGGGGGANNSRSGGGGAGGLLQGSATLTPQSYAVTIGAGGAGGVYSTRAVALPGGNSSFNGQIAIGGGRGGSYGYAAVDYNGGNGGSGGGGRAISGTAGSGIAGQGYNGGAGPVACCSAGGGGGAGGVGATAGAGGAGGPGVSSSITGSAVTYATGGLGGSGTGTPGAANTGNGGGGAPGYANGGAGGSGVVIVRYLTP